MSNKEIVKAVLRESLIFKCKAFLHEKWSNEKEVCIRMAIGAPSMFTLSDLYSLKLHIQEKGGNIKDIEVHPRKDILICKFS